MTDDVCRVGAQTPVALRVRLTLLSRISGSQPRATADERKLFITVTDPNADAGASKPFERPAFAGVSS
jgi:hypothetical protein